MYLVFDAWKIWLQPNKAAENTFSKEGNERWCVLIVLFTIRYMSQNERWANSLIYSLPDDKIFYWTRPNWKDLWTTTYFFFHIKDNSWSWTRIHGFTTLRNGPFENIVGKKENASNHIFSISLSETETVIQATSNSSSANTSNLVNVKILPAGSVNKMEFMNP